MEEATIKKGYRNGWIFIGLAVLFIVTFFWFAVDQNSPQHEPEWNMGGQKFVPASSPYGSGYYVPSTNQNQKGKQP